jgi:hypothetical protein
LHESPHELVVLTLSQHLYRIDQEAILVVKDFFLKRNGELIEELFFL